MNALPVPGTDGKYSISADGRVYNARTGKMLRQFENASGYLTTQLRVRGRARTQLVHRLVAAAFIPNPSTLPQVNHKDGNKKNNHITNLEWVTASGNIRHSLVIGIKPILRGEAHGRTTLTDEQVRAIKAAPILRKYGHATKLAREYGVDISVISGILRGRNWKHV